MKEKLKASESLVITQKQEFEALADDMQKETEISREANATLKEEYEILEERFKKHARMSEDQTNDLDKDLKNMADKCKKLQDFYDKHDAILQDERTASQTQIITLSKEKDEVESFYKKELDKTNTKLETLEGEFQVKMMKIRLQELELENKLTDHAEAQEQKEHQFTQMEREVKKLRIEAEKQAKNVTALKRQKEELAYKIKQLEGDDDA